MWTGVSVWEKGSWWLVAIAAPLPDGLHAADIAASRVRGVNSGADGFSIELYKKEVIRDCQENTYDNDSLAVSIPLACGPMVSPPAQSAYRCPGSIPPQSRSLHKLL